MNKKIKQTKNISYFFRILEKLSYNNFKLNESLLVYFISNEESITAYILIGENKDQELNFEDVKKFESQLELLSESIIRLPNIDKTEFKNIIEIITEKYLIRNSVAPMSIQKPKIYLTGHYTNDTELHIYYHPSILTDLENDLLRQRRYELSLIHPMSSQTTSILEKNQAMSLEEMIDNINSKNTSIRILKSSVN